MAQSDSPIDFMSCLDHSLEDYNFIPNLSQKRSQNSPENFPGERELDRRSRNKIAAKESRNRKKIFIELKEAEIAAMEAKLHAIDEEIELCKIEIEKGTFATSHYIGELDSKLQHVYTKMIGLINSEQVQERNNETNLCLDSICYRVGATGKERKFNINECYKHIVNLSIPNLHRYILWSAHENVHLFQQGGIDEKGKRDEKWFEEMANLLAKKQFRHPLLIEKQKHLQGKRKDMLQLVARLFRIKQLMQNQGIDLDNLFLDVRELLTPTQSVKFIIFIEKYRYRSQLRYHEGIVDEDQSQPHKKNKRQ